MIVHEAADAEVSAILRWTYGLWGGGRTFEAYEARWKGLLAHPWSRDHFRFMLATEEGTPVSACKLYRFEMGLAGRAVSAIGFGAVFTPEGLRGRGYAAVMLQTIMRQEAARGTDLALLYSDIGTAYYERLGFVALGGQLAMAEALEGASPFRAVAEGEWAEISGWHRNDPSPLAHVRSADYWDYLLMRDPTELLAFAPEGRPLGFAAVESQEGQLFVVAAGLAPETSESAFWTGLRHEAQARGLSTVAGWLPRETEAYGYQRQPQAKAIPMVAPLQGQQVPDGVSLWALDHF